MIYEVFHNISMPHLLKIFDSDLLWNLLDFYLETENLQRLVLTERIEFVIPLTYMLCILIAYYGPNAEILGGIKVTIWHYVAIPDLTELFSNLSILIFVDTMSFIINGVIIQLFCKINIMNILKQLQHDFWFLMAVFEAFCFMEVNFSFMHY